LTLASYWVTRHFTADAEKILANIKKLDDRIETSKVSMEDRESNKTVALGTSK